MRLPLFIANRYLLAKKSHNLINIITWISIIGISVASFALIVVLSAFNGLERVISTMNSRLAPDLEISPALGKTIDLASFPLEELQSLSAVSYALPTLTEDALFRYDDKQHFGRVKGVGPEYQQIERLNEVMFGDASMVIEDGERRFAIPGTGVAWHLGINPYSPYAAIRIYVPKRGNASQMSLENGFNSEVLGVQSTFSTQQEIDEELVLVPFEWLSELLEFDGKASQVELFLASTAEAGKVKKEVKAQLGPDFQVKDQQEQMATLYRIMRSEKWAVYVILTFILILATFNVVGSLSMLMIEKRKDTGILKAMGADQSLVRRIFLNEGLLISVAGGVIGLALGIVLVLLQQRFGFVKFGSGGSYVVDAYPVWLKLKDVLLIFATILVVGAGSAWLTVRGALRQSDSSNQ